MSLSTPSPSQGFRVMRNQNRDLTLSGSKPPCKWDHDSQTKNHLPETGGTLELSGDPMVGCSTTLSAKAGPTQSDTPDVKS